MKEKHRLVALDGLRGFAILLVVLNHIKTPFISSVIPQRLAEILFSSGVTGVSILFALSGFLMMYIYPNPKSGLAFIQKRYTRIFPLFLTMCAVMFVFYMFPKAPWYILVGILILFAAIAHSIWVYVVKKKFSEKAKKILFLSFLFLQIFMGVFYVFWIMKHPPIVFNQQIPASIKNGTIFLVNGTLTLPFGNYIPMLDGVYWSLVSEIYFYILYPIVCLPLVYFFLKKSNYIQLLLLIVLIPFFAGLDILSHKIFVLSLLQLPLCYYFITGIVLGYFYRNHTQLIEKIDKLFPKNLYLGSILLLFLIIIVKIFALDSIDRTYSGWVHLLWSFPITFIIALALNPKTSLSKFLSARILLFAGMISYSVYLSHALVIHILESIFLPINLFTNVLFIFITFLLAFIVGYFLYVLLEKPYFRKSEIQLVQSEIRSNRLR